MTQAASGFFRSVLDLSVSLQTQNLADERSMPTSVRGTLLEITALILARENSHAGVIAPEVSRCPNCGTLAKSVKSPYCGERCREIAGFVRQFRAALKDRTIFDEEKQEVMGQILWHLLGGGRPARISLVPDKVVSQVLAKANHLCQVCGERASTVDHLRTGCNRPINLQAVCLACNRSKPFGDPSVTSKPEYEPLLQELAQRVGAEVPLRCCDDAEIWNWREYVKLRKVQLSPAGAS